MIHAIYVEMIAPILLFTRYRISANGYHQIAVYPQQCISKRCLQFASHPLQYATTFEVTRRLVRANGCHQFAVSFHRYSVLANGSCTLKVIRYPVYAKSCYRQAVSLGHYISAWVLQCVASPLPWLSKWLLSIHLFCYHCSWM